MKSTNSFKFSALEVLLLCLISILSHTLVAQTLALTVKDARSERVLPFANVYFQQAGTGGSTNMKGIVEFERETLHRVDTLIVTYVGYETYKQEFHLSRTQTGVSISLTPSNQLLEEAVVRYVKPPKPEKIIRTALKRTAKNYPVDNALYTSLYRETVAENGQLIQLNEGIIKTYYTGYPQRKLDHTIWKDWFYDQSYAFDLEGDRFFRPLLKDFNTKEDHQIVVATRQSQNHSAIGIETILIGDPLLLFALDKIKYQYDFMNPSLLNKYVFKLEYDEQVRNEDCYVISFHPKQSNKRFSIDQSRKNKRAIYVGRMYISKTSFALLKFSYKLAVDRDYGFFSKRIPLDYKVEMNYKKQGDAYVIDNVQLTETKSVGMDEKGASVLHEATRALYVTNAQLSNIEPYPDSLRYKSTRFSAIRCFKSNYNPQYWDSLIGKPYQLDERGIRQLERNSPLKTQFEQFKNPVKEQLKIPLAKKEHHEFHYPTTVLIDSLYWMVEEETALRSYVEEENRFAKNELIEDKQQQRKLFNELNLFYERDTTSLLGHAIGSYYLDTNENGDDILYYQEDSTAKQKVFNFSEFKDKHPNGFVTKVIPNVARDLVIIQFEISGIPGNLVEVFPFGSKNPIDSLSHVYSCQWLSDSALVFTQSDMVGRAGKLLKHQVFSSESILLYEEPDKTFDVVVDKQNGYLFCTIQSKTENEIYAIKRKGVNTSLELIKERRDGVVHTVKATSDGLYILTSDEDAGSVIERHSLEDPSKSAFVAKSQAHEHIVDFLPVGNYMVVMVYDKSMPKIMYQQEGERKWSEVKTNLGLGSYQLTSTATSEPGFQFIMSSPSQVDVRFEYHFESKELIEKESLLNTKNDFHFFNRTERIWAKSQDGTKVPMTVISSRQHNQDGPVILKTYGAYGAILTPSFDAQESVLLAQGFTIVYAHVRGGAILGPMWYKDGRVLEKKHSIEDYLACAKHLINKGIASPEKLVGYGNSAGGIVVAQAMNLHPEMFNTVILDHPYLDVVNTMMNDTLPLTIDEYKEWGNPQEERVFQYMMEYSPYQNVRPQPYPNVLLIGSYLDYQTPIWQIAKFAAELRHTNTAATDVLMLTDMNSGHIGSTTGKEWIKLFAETYSYVRRKTEK